MGWRDRFDSEDIRRPPSSLQIHFSTTRLRHIAEPGIKPVFLLIKLKLICKTRLQKNGCAGFNRKPPTKKLDIETFYLYNVLVLIGQCLSKYKGIDADVRDDMKK